MKTAVFIASVGRPKKLSMAVNSVPEKYRVLVHCQDKKIDANVPFNRKVEISEYPNMSRNDRGNLGTKKLDGYNVLCMCDDTRIFNDTIENAERQLQEKFNGTMGICGLKAFNVGHTTCSINFAFCLYGNDWINQFIDRKMSPDNIYNKYYIDYEWYTNALARNCWTFCEDAQILHDHRFKNKEDLEQFNKDIIRDRDVFYERVKKGKCWGITEGCLNPVDKIDIRINNL